MIPRLPLLLALGATLACASSAPAEPVGEPVAYALDGRPLYRPALSEAQRDRLERQTARALGHWRAEPENQDAWIWYGRRLAYEGRFDEAVEHFSEALRRFPESSRLLRHRGHRNITTRRLYEAITDLAGAVERIQDEPDAIEEDGAPNAYGIPRSTRHSNVYYHLGLAHYLVGEYAQAERAYLAGQSVSRVNDDMLVAFNWWHWLATQRMLARTRDRLPGFDDSFWDGRLRDLLAPVGGPMDVLENHAYHRLLLMAKGELTPEDVLPENFDDVAAATLAYGVAAYHLAEGRNVEGYALCRRIVRTTPWAAFGHIAAEAELQLLAQQKEAERAAH